MRLLLDTHIVLAIVNDDVDTLPKKITVLLYEGSNELLVSAASLWEIAIKFRLGKLRVESGLAHLGQTCSAFGLQHLQVEASHVTANVEPWPATRDPFDRLLLAQAQVEGLLLVTLDHALVDHPLTWKA
jgi:PIN domain nuclease of toxin-antitoxin system